MNKRQKLSFFIRSASGVEIEDIYRILTEKGVIEE